jgi:carbamoyltransferase
MGTELAMLVVGNCVVLKEEQNLALIKDYKNAYDLD